jgi:N-carbamoyl-L-amino-acid hydrolase
MPIPIRPIPCCSGETPEGFYDLFRSECNLVAEERGGHFDRRLESAPAIMDADRVQRLRRAVRAAIGEAVR